MKRFFYLITAALALLPISPQSMWGKDNPAKHGATSNIRQKATLSKPGSKSHKAVRNLPWLMETKKGPHSGLVTPLMPIKKSPKSNISKRLTPAKIEEEIPTIYGNLTFNNEWYYSEPQPGIYSFPADLSSSAIPVIIDPEFVTTGGVMFDGAFYGYSFDSVEEIDYWLVYDIESELMISKEEVDFSYSPTDLTYNKKNGLIYGNFLNLDGDDYELCAINPKTLDRTVINDTNFLQYERLVCIATHPDGRMFGITLSGLLEEIDPETGAVTPIASVGITPSNYVQSATFDAKTGYLYWAAQTIAGQSLIVIDVDNLYLGDIGDFYNNEEWSGLYILGERINDEAPSKPDNITFSFNEGATKGTVSFTLPTLDNNGNALKGDVNYEIMIDDETKVSGKDAPGAHVCHTLSTEPGYRKFEVIVSNSFGKGEIARQRVWIGNDTPQTVSNINLTFEGRQATLTWDAPTQGIHGGYINPEKVTYTITRLPDNITVAKDWIGTSYTEEIPDTSLTLYHYNITPTFGGLTGEAATSNRVWNGHAFIPPYSNDFSDLDSRELFTILDFDEYKEDPNDPYSICDKWFFFESWADCRLRILTFVNQDDWVLMPPVNMTTDRDYVFYAPYETFLNEEQINNYIEVYAGQGENIADYKRLNHTLYTDENQKYIKAVYAPEANGDYHFAIRAKGVEDNATYWEILSIHINVNHIYEAPAAVNDFNVTSGKNGDLSAFASFSAPSTNGNGEKLTSIDRIDIEVDGETVKSIDNPQPGKSITATLSDLTNGNHVISAVAYNTAGKGQTASRKIFIGHDIPEMVRNLNTVDNQENLIISWDAPEIGFNGGYFNPNELKYNVYSYDSYWGNFSKLGETTELTWTDSPVITSDQRLLQYAVGAATSAGESEIKITKGIAVGDAWELPFKETFTDCGLDNSLWWNDSYDYAFYIAPCLENPGDDMDASGGFASYGGDVPAEMTSGKISLKGTQNPCIIMGYYALKDSNNILNIGVYDDHQTYHLLQTINYAEYTGEEGWKQIVISLNDVKDSRYINLSFEGLCNDSMHPIMIDNIRVRDILDHNLTSYLKTPSHYTVGRKATAFVTVENYGLNDAIDYQIRILANGQEVASTDGERLKFSEEKTYALDFTVPSLADIKSMRIESIVDYAQDCDKTDNTRIATIEVRANEFPMPENLNVNQSSDNITLSWDKPEISTNSATTDDFEDYDPWITDGFGDWTTVDRDGAITYSHSLIRWPRQSEPHAYMVFNPSDADPNYEDLIEFDYDFRPHSGEQYLVSFCPDEWYAYDTQSDDWLISPELSGRQQTISFYAKSLIKGMEEFIVVHYSSDDNQIENFIPLIDYLEVDSQWTKYEFELPEGAKYFAIQHISIEMWALFIDDITYQTTYDNLNPIGFTVYRDGEKIADLPWDVTTFSDYEFSSDEHLYQVTARYDYGESSPASIIVNSTGVKAINGARFNTVDEGGFIAVYGCEGRHLEISTVDGILRYSGVPDETLRIEAEKGIYILKSGNMVQKLIVK